MVPLPLFPALLQGTTEVTRLRFLRGTDPWVGAALLCLVGGVVALAYARERRDAPGVVSGFWFMLRLSVAIAVPVVVLSNRAVWSDLIEARGLSGAAALALVASLAIATQLVLAIGLQVLSERTSFRDLAIGALAVLRFAAVAVAVLCLFEPTLSHEVIEVKESVVALLVDESLSMGLEDKYASPDVREGLARAADVEPEAIDRMSRLQVLRRALLRGEPSVLDKLREANRLKVFAFAARPRPILDLPRGSDVEGRLSARARVEELVPVGEMTAIGDCVNKVVNDLRGQRIAAVVLFTDGRSTGASVLEADKVARRLRQRGVPLIAVGIGNPEDPKDIAVSDLEAADVAVAGDYVPFDFAVTSQGFDEVVEAELRRDGELVKTEPVTLKGSGERQQVRIQFRPERPGEFTFTVKIPPRPGELTEENNARSHRLRVVDKKIKVLYVEGLPRYEYRALKNGLIRDETMEVQCLLLSADPDFPQESTKGVVPLRAFPKSREELFQYHVVIFGDVDPRAFSEEQLKLVKEFVEDFGGGFLMIAGENDSPVSFLGTPIEPILPVEIEDTRRTVARPDHLTQPFVARLTLEGRDHRILRLENDAEQNARLFGEGTDASAARPLPGFYWFFEAKRAKPAARVLAVHPTRTHPKYGPFPIWAVHYVGAGTVLFSAVDETWRWRAGVGDKYFYRFWRQALRHLSSGLLTKTKRFSLNSDKTEYTIGEAITLTATVLDRDLKPSTEKAQTVYVERPDGQRQPMELGAEPGAPGQFKGSLKALKIGEYKAWIGPESPTPGEELAYKDFRVKVPQLEYADPKMDEAALRKMAEAAAGRYFPAAEIADVPKAVEPIVERVPRSASEQDLWDRSEVLLLFGALLVAEWLLRKLARLL